MKYGAKKRVTGRWGGKKGENKVKEMMDEKGEECRGCSPVGWWESKVLL